MPRPGFPRTLVEFQAQFADDDSCRAYLAACRWPDGYRCSRCRSDRAFGLPRRCLWQCKACGHQTSVTAGTALHKSRMSLREWFWAAYLVSTHTPGISAVQLRRQLGIRRYETAWTMLHKLRRAMVRPDRDRLRGTVEVDETYFSAPDGLVGRAMGKMTGDRVLVVGAVEVRGRASGRVRLALAPDASGPSLTGFVSAHVEPGTIVVTDGWQGYAPLRRLDYQHRPTTQGPPERADKILPRIHRVFSNLKTWLRGTHRSVHYRHLPAYLNEFAFRFNRRRTPMAAFQSLLGLTTVHAPTTYKGLYGSE